MPLFDSNDLGPLPIADDNATLQRESLTALQAALPEDRFILRDERIEDYGVDVSLELRLNRRATNLRSQVQLKGTQQARRLVDGTLTYKVRVSNLNYLLNGNAPIYMLWEKSSGQLWWTWARVEMQRISLETPNWDAQTEAVLHFSHRLNDQALDQISQRIRQEARLQRRVLEFVHRLTLPTTEAISATQGARLWIQGVDLQVLDPTELERLLREEGEILVSAGYGTQVLEAVERLDVTSASSPKIQLLAAYAYFSLGRYDACSASLVPVMSRINEFDDEEKEFGRFLRDATQFSQGRLSQAQYEERLAQRERDSSLYAVMHRLDAARAAIRGQGEPIARAKLLEQAREIAQKQENDATLPLPGRLWARLARLEVAGEQMVTEGLKAIFRGKLRQEMGLDPDLEQSTDSLSERADSWLQEINATLREATIISHPILTGQAFFVRATLETGLLLQTHFLQTHLGLYATPQDKEMLKEMRFQAMRDAEEARALLQRVGHTENELQAAMQLCDLFELAGQDEAVRRLAESVETQADALNLDGIVRHARAHLNEDTPLKRLERNITEMQTENRDARYAAMSDEDIRQSAAMLHHLHRLPLERLPIIERAVFCQRDVSHERWNGCRHFQMMTNTSRPEDPQHHWAQEPVRFFVCLKHQYATIPFQGDWNVQLADFRNRYCAECPDRSPLMEDA